MITRILRVVLGFTLAIVTAVVFYLGVILGMPQDDGTDKQAVTILPSLSRSFSSLHEIDHEAFPARFLLLADGSGWHFTGGTAVDAAFDSGLARRIDLRWQDDQGHELVCSTVCPAEAVGLLTDSSYELASGRSVAVAGIGMVYSKKPDGYRFHASGSDAAYAVYLPRLESQSVLDLLQLVMLVSPITQ